MEHDLDDVCDALEAMIDAADDAWEAERMCLVKVKDDIFRDRYAPAKEKFRRALDRYIDARIQRHHKRSDDAYYYSFDEGHDL